MFIGNLLKYETHGKRIARGQIKRGSWHISKAILVQRVEV